MAASLLPGASSSLAALIWTNTWQEGGKFKNTVPAVVAKCDPSALVATLYKLRDPSALSIASKHLICSRLAFLEAIHKDRAGIGAILIFGSVLIPFALRLCYQAASPNRPTPLQGAVLPILALTLTSVSSLVIADGYGIFIAPIVALIYSMGARFAAADEESKRKEVPALPVPTRAAYGANLATIACAVFLGSAAMHDASLAEGTYWWEAYTSASNRSIAKPSLGALSDLWPLAVAAPIYVLGLLGTVRPRDKESADKLLQSYSAEEVAYGFERTWAYYRQAGLISAATYLFGVSMMARSIYQDQAGVSPCARYLLAVSAVVALAHIGTLTVDTKSAPEPDAVDKEGREAIAKAPAGNPGLEDSPRALILLGLVAGPSLPAMLWHAHNEELAGWKGRRAWRSAVAEKKK